MNKPFLGDVAREVPGRTGDLVRSLERMKKSLAAAQERLREGAATASANRDRELAARRRRLASQAEREIRRIDAELDALRAQTAERAQRRAEADTVDYARYSVDRSVPHTIAEDLTNRRPAGYELQGARREADTWKQILVEVCRELGRQDPMLFATLGDDPELQGRRRPRLSADPTRLLSPARVPDAAMYVETHLSTRQMRGILRALLQKYGIPETDLLLYFHRDYSPLREERKEKKRAAAGAAPAHDAQIDGQMRLDLEGEPEE